MAIHHTLLLARHRLPPTARPAIMHQSQAYSAKPHRKPQPTSSPGNTDKAEKNQCSSQGMQKLTTGLSRVSVSGSSDNDTSTQNRYQSPKPRGAMVNHGDGQEWRTTGWQTQGMESRVPHDGPDGGSWRPARRGHGAERDQGDFAPGWHSPFRNLSQRFYPEQFGNAGSRPRHQHDLPPPPSANSVYNRSPRQHNRGGHVSPHRSSSRHSDSRRPYDNMNDSARYQAHDSYHDSYQPTNRSPSSAMNGSYEREPRHDVQQRARRSVTPIRQQPVHEPVETRSRLHVDPSIKFEPITQSNCIPPHLQHPFRSYPSGTTFDVSEALQSEPVTARHPTPEYFTMAQASPNVYYANPPRDTIDPRSSRKLVVLDLNGAMLVRSGRSTDPILNIQRKVYPRPFLSAFLDYMLQPARPVNDWSNPSNGSSQQMRPYEAFVWSSAQPLNVDTMIRLSFGKWGMPTSPNARDRVVCEEMLARFERVESRPGRILGVWTRMEMDLTKAQYGMYRWNGMTDFPC